jgi:hypothetical protein
MNRKIKIAIVNSGVFLEQDYKMHPEAADFAERGCEY